ncbi:hypothetical protein THPR109532_10275 [Thalassospira profundimaris]
MVEHDLGFAPNPFFGFCTLAACKPRIRKHASVGDLVVGTGATKPGLVGSLVYWMRVEDIISFDEYWMDPRFICKRPKLIGSYVQRYGDNIYHRDFVSGEYLQEDSFHSEPNGVLSRGNLERDTGATDNVLISKDYAYWGKCGPVVPDNLKGFVKKGVGHKSKFTSKDVALFCDWVFSLSGRGYVGEPSHWQYL